MKWVIGGGIVTTFTLAVILLSALTPSVSPSTPDIEAAHIITSAREVVSRHDGIVLHLHEQEYLDLTRALVIAETYTYPPCEMK